MKGAWSNYVETDLIPRLNGFELLMASYAMAHLKLDMLLTETGYTSERNQRLRIYLTNSLEEAHPDTGTLFANWLSTEASEANTIKRDSPVMVILGNPPYSVSSSNKSEWIEDLIYDYKKDLNEKSYNSLSDDYVKFIRYGQHFIDKNGEYISIYLTVGSGKNKRKQELRYDNEKNKFVYQGGKNDGKAYEGKNSFVASVTDALVKIGWCCRSAGPWRFE